MHPPRALTRIALVDLLPGQSFPPPDGDFGELCVDLDRETHRLGHHARRVLRSPEGAASSRWTPRPRIVSAVSRACTRPTAVSGESRLPW